MKCSGCALTGAIVFGPQLRRLSVPWRWFIVILYISWLISFLGDIGFSITTSIGGQHRSFDLLVGIEDDPPVGVIYEAQWRSDPQLSTAGLVELSTYEPRAEQM